MHSFESAVTGLRENRDRNWSYKDDYKNYAFQHTTTEFGIFNFVFPIYYEVYSKSVALKKLGYKIYSMYEYGQKQRQREYAKMKWIYMGQLSLLSRLSIRF